MFNTSKSRLNPDYSGFVIYEKENIESVIPIHMVSIELLQG